MFNALFADETGHSGPPKTDGQASSDSVGEASTPAPANPLLNLWSVAAAVRNTVKARADDLVKSVVDTDWRTELSQFSREVGEESKTLKEKTAELVEHLPEKVGQLPEKAEEALIQLPSQVHLPKDVGQTLEGVSVAFAQFGKNLLQGTKELIDELKDGVETEIAAASREGKRAARGKSATASAAKLATVQAKYNRFEAEVAAMQRDSSTYCDEPEDAEEYARWKSGFSLDGVKPDIARMMTDNTFMAELQARLVPIIVEHDDFWHRYFYRLHKLQQKEEQRQQLAQRAKSLHEDDVPLGWGDEDEAAPASHLGTAAGPSEPRLPQPHAAAPPEPAAPLMKTSSGEAVAVEADSVDVRPAQEAPPSAAAAKAPVASEVERQPVGAVGAAATAADVAVAAAAVTSESVSGVADTTGPRSVEATEGGREGRSGGGASAAESAANSGSSVHMDSEAAQAECEQHAETASDSSTKEWCVVTSDAPPPAPADPPAAEAVPPLPESQEQAARAAPSAPGAAPAVTDEHATQGGASAADAPPPAQPPGAAAQERKAAARAAAKGGDDEELDEDWGNWD